MPQTSEAMARWAARIWAAGDEDIAAVYGEEWTSVVQCAAPWRRLIVALLFAVGASAHAGRLRLARRRHAGPRIDVPVDTMTFKVALPTRRTLVVRALGLLGTALVRVGQATRAQSVQRAGSRALLAGLVLGAGPGIEDRLRALLFVVAIAAFAQHRRFSSGRIGVISGSTVHLGTVRVG